MKKRLQQFLILPIICNLNAALCSGVEDSSLSIVRPRSVLPRVEDLSVVTYGMTSSLKEMVLCSERGDKVGAVRMLQTAHQSLLSLQSFAEKMKDGLRARSDETAVYNLALGKKQQALGLVQEKLENKKSELNIQKVWVSAEIEKAEVDHSTRCKKIKRDTEVKQSEVQGDANAASAVGAVVGIVGLICTGPIGWGLAIGGGAVIGAAQGSATADSAKLRCESEADLERQRSMLAAKQAGFDRELRAVSEKIRRTETVASDASRVATQAERHHQELRALGATLENAAREWRSFMVLTEGVDGGYSQVEKAIKRLGTRPGASGGEIQLAINKWAQLDSILRCADWVKVGEIDLTLTVSTMRSMDEIIARC